MRTALLVCLIAILATPMGAQVTDSLPRDTVLEEYRLPHEVALEIAALYNQPAALRASGTVVISADQQVTGDVAVLGGPLTLAGRVSGRVVLVNGNVTLRSGASVGGDLIVVGGTIQ